MTCFVLYAVSDAALVHVFVVAVTALSIPKVPEKAYSCLLFANFPI